MNQVLECTPYLSRPVRSLASVEATAQMTRWRAESRACVVRKLKLAQADYVRRDLKTEHVVERLNEWLDWLRGEMPKAPPAEMSAGTQIARRLALSGVLP